MRWGLATEGGIRPRNAAVSRSVRLESAFFQHSEQILGYALGLKISVNLGENTALAIVIAQRQRLFFERLQANSDGFFAVIFPESELGTFFVTDLVRFGRIGVNVVDRPANRTGAATGEALEQLVVLNGDFD